MIISILSIVVAFGIVVFIHEFGHFIACKIVGIQVLKFAFAFGKEILGFTWKGTRYSLGWIPLGGYVKPAGEDYFEQTKETEEKPKPNDYFGKPWYARLLVVIMGPIMNYALAVAIFTMVFWIWGGNPHMSQTTVIGSIMPGMAAEQAGLRAQDRIIKIQNKSVDTWDHMARIIHRNAGIKLLLEIQRGDKVINVTVTPQKDSNSNVGLIGIYPDMIIEKLNFIQSAGQGIIMTWLITGKTISYITDKIRKFEKPADVSGPIGIFKFISDAAHSGFREYISFLAFLSAAIGLFNLFPIPMLDGGHIFFYVFEGLFRKPLNRRLMLTANSIGMAILITVVVYATYNDIKRFKQSKHASTAADVQP